MAAKSFISTPNAFALKTAVAIASAEPPSVSFVAAEMSFIPSSTSLSLMARPVVAFNSFTCPLYSTVCSSNVFLVRYVVSCNSPSASPERPASFVSLVKVFRFSALNFAYVPYLLFISLNVLFRFLVVPKNPS